jgi:DNA-binding NarL/FixJ family response regulator
MSKVRGMRCLIVDDNEALAAAVARLLRSQGLDVVACASSVEDALRVAERLEPDVALVDIELGGEDGLVLSRRLAARAPSTRVILVSSYGADELGDLVERSPAVGFLPKSELGAAAIARLLG